MKTFRAIHTLYGLQRMAAAEAAGVPINLVDMAVGDGNGNPTTPAEDQTQLVRERYRATVNRVYQDPADATLFTAELVVPAEIGGFTIRECGIFDDQGSLFVVANIPDAYKPAENEGAYSDTIVRLQFMVSNADVVTLMVDPNVAVVTQTWIVNNITPALLFPGGTTAQMLVKKSNADGDTEWADPDDVNVTVDMIEEHQDLVDAQTAVDWAIVTNRGLAVFIDGLRINRGAATDEWQPDGLSDTRIILGKSYPSGTKILGTQNEPTGSAPRPLERSQNLSDVESAPTARTNLNVFSKQETRQMAPPGLVDYFATTTAPSGWLKANGAAISRTAYADLYAAIGERFGNGDGFTTFNLPDLRGDFLRAWDDGRGVDGGRELGSLQMGGIQSHAHDATSAPAGGHVHNGTATAAGQHTHSATTGTAGEHTHSGVVRPESRFIDGDDRAFYAGGSGKSTDPAGAHSHSVSIGNAGSHSHQLSINSAGEHSHDVAVKAAGGSETRPRNVALLVCIKY